MIAINEKIAQKLIPTNFAAVQADNRQWLNRTS